MSASITAFRPIKPRKQINLETLAKVIAQMQGLMDSAVDPANETEVAMHGLVETWHTMLQGVLVNEAKRQ